ncbi:MAG: UdgX family uracil-DNA binding protein [Massilia sp.]
MSPHAAPHVGNFAQWRVAAKAFLARGVAPAEAAWGALSGAKDLFASEAVPTPVDAGAVPVLHLPRALVEMLEAAACFTVEDRWSFLYKVLWRWQRGQSEVISLADDDGARLHAMVKAVHREEHDMHAYLRFRERKDADDPPRFVAWFEPVHEVLPQVARHFSRRMGNTSWLIATPGLAMAWDGERLMELASPLSAAPAIDDAGESLWLTYYRNIFNPARLNADLMRSHIPLRFWKNLPEGAVAAGMISAAAHGERRTGQRADLAQRRGAATIDVTPARAQPQREGPSVLDQCRRCSLWQTATQAVPGVGPASARIMVVGEQPGDQEDLQGLPFVGPAGAVLERAFAEAGVDRNNVYLTNAVKHFKWEPRGKRRMHKTPAQKEVEACHLWLERELDNIQPQVIVALGSTALKSVLQDAKATLKGSMVAPVQHEGRTVIAVYHPSYVLRAPDEATRHAAYAVIVEGLRQARLLAGK